ncbi:hypothetical protein H4CHR_04888 [Variovorax sp. PBS-H4]|uniref:hypothetical protein n=1 Tax=Variovorax sp. PBS-H4 TaxID=434008 RepID=UPI00131878EF|nr:hypothetical protein [Variovorax sp. PBS-H4]VTU39980.1 hypothetical protein H4CHR_04888 [Variovorax sp. PBS-H4]
MVIEITNYYALPGSVEAVLAQRRLATEIRAQLGLPPGRIFRKLEGAGPDVRWECVFDSREDYERDMAARGASGEFARARQEMHTLLERFERHLQEEAE